MPSCQVLTCTSAPSEGPTHVGTDSLYSLNHVLAGTYTGTSGDYDGGFTRIYTLTQENTYRYICKATILRLFPSPGVSRSHHHTAGDMLEIANQSGGFSQEKANSKLYRYKIRTTPISVAESRDLQTKHAK